MKRIIILLNALIFFALCIYAQAAPNSADKTGVSLKDNTVREIPVISMVLNDLPLYDALQQLLNAAGIEKSRIVIADTLRHPPLSNVRVDLKLDKVKLDTALKQIFDKYNLYALYGTPDRYIFINTYADIISYKKVSIDIKDIPVDKAIAKVFKDSGYKYTIGPGVTGKVSLKLNDINFSSAVTALAKTANVMVTNINGTCGFYIKPKITDVILEVIKGNSSIRSANNRISIDMNDTPLCEAIGKLFEGQNLQYSLAPELNLPPYDKIKVSMKLVDIPVTNAISALLKSHQLSIRKDNDAYYIAPADMAQFDPTGEQVLGELEFRIKSPHNSNSSAPSGPGPQGGPAGFGGGAMPVMAGMMPGNEAFAEPMLESRQDMITISILQMPVKDAIEKVEPGWTFNGDLGDTIMPGAKFYNLQKDMAVGIILQAAGLLIPDNGSKVISEKGRNDLNMIYTWKPQASRNDYDPMANVNFGGKSFAVPGIGTTSNAISIGAYKNSNSWSFTVLAGRAYDTVLLRRLMDISGKNHVIGNIQSRPYATTQTIYNSKSEPSKIQYIQYGPPSTISVQLYDVALDEALDNILPLVGLIYKKKGASDNPVYSIEVKPLDNTIKPGAISKGTVKTPVVITDKKK
ncbi:MAG: hypothetical protein ACYC27_11840 [Armatimonadota bacterium]